MNNNIMIDVYTRLINELDVLKQDLLVQHKLESELRELKNRVNVLHKELSSRSHLNTLRHKRIRNELQLHFFGRVE